jgi:hypothetical protein
VKNERFAVDQIVNILNRAIMLSGVTPGAAKKEMIAPESSGVYTHRAVWDGDGKSGELGSTRLSRPNLLVPYL